MTSSNPNDWICPTDTTNGNVTQAIDYWFDIEMLPRSFVKTENEEFNSY